MRAKPAGMANPDDNFVIALTLVVVVLVAALNFWAYRDAKKRNLTMKEAEDELRDDPTIWWP